MSVIQPTWLHRCEAIAGWMHTAELEWLHAQAATRRYIVEIGVYCGKSTVALATATPGMVYGIDSWEGGPIERDKWHPEYETEAGRDAVYLKALQNVHGLNVSLLRLNSLLAYQLFQPKTIDMLFIDGGHDYESVKSDLDLYRPLCKDNALICGHDYSATWPGVVQAVNEHFGKRVKTAPYSIWYVEPLPHEMFTAFGAY